LHRWYLNVGWHGICLIAGIRSHCRCTQSPSGITRLDPVKPPFPCPPVMESAIKCNRKWNINARSAIVCKFWQWHYYSSGFPCSFNEIFTRVSHFCCCNGNGKLLASSTRSVDVLKMLKIIAHIQKVGRVCVCMYVHIVENRGTWTALAIKCYSISPHLMDATKMYD